MTSKKSQTILFSIFSAVAILAVGAFALFFAGCGEIKEDKKDKIFTYSVQNFEELKSALAEDVEDAEKIISIGADLEFSEVLSINSKVTINSAKDVTLMRASELDDSYFSVEKEGALELRSQNKILFEGNQALKSKPALANLGALTLGENVEFQNFVGNQRGVVINSSGVLEIDGAEIHDSKLEEGVSGVYGVVYNGENATFNFKSGKFYNNSTPTPGILFINNNVNAKFTGGEIFGNTCTANGMIYIKSATVEFDSDCKIYQNHAANGIIYFNNEAKAIIDGAEITENNTTSNGGALYLTETATVTINSGKINKNTSAKAGGAIYQDKTTTLVMNGGEVSENVAGTYGGIVYINGSSKFELNDGTLKNNKSTNSGGGVFVNGSSTFVMNGGWIDGTTTEASNSNGGAIINKSVTIINGGKISNSITAQWGGAIRSYFDSNDNAKLTINGGVFENNKNTIDGAYGGAIHCVTPLEVTGGEFIGNSSKGNGGAIYFGTGCTGSISGATFKKNTSDLNGGAVYFVTNCEGVLKNCTFEENSAASGGAVFAISKNLSELSQSTFNSNSATNGGAIYLANTVNVEMVENNFRGNKAEGSGAGIYTLAASQKIVGGEFCENVAQKAGGGIYTRSANLEIDGTTFSSNESGSSGGGGLAVHGDGKTVANAILNNTKFENNTTQYRGPDIYAFCDAKTLTPVVTINDGVFEHIGVQYATLKMGGDVTISDKIQFHASKTEDYAYLEITKEILNPFSINTRDACYAEEKSTTKNPLIRFAATDPWSNIYSQVRKIHLLSTSSTDVEKPGFCFQVVDGKILMQKEDKKINVNADVLAVDVPLYAKTEQVVKFKAFAEFSVSNVKIINNSTNEQVEVQEVDGEWSFTMPDADVTITYDATSSLELLVDENIQSCVEVQQTYQFLEDVNVALKKQFEKKATKLFVELGNGTTVDLLENPTFKMFKGARIQGETSPYFAIDHQQDERIQNFVFMGADLDDNGKAYTIEGAIAKFKFDMNPDPNFYRYFLTEVYYEFNGGKVVLEAENGIYSLTMPQGNIEIKFVFEDLLANFENAVVVIDENQLEDALRQYKMAVVKDEIVMTKTIVLDEGEHQVVGVKNAKLTRDETFKGAFFDIGFKSSLTLGIDQEGEFSLILDGNGEKVEEISNAIVVCRDNGILNIYDGVSICNNILTTENDLFSAQGEGMGTVYNISNIGGAGIVNFFGQVNMFGGEIFNNHTLGAIHGAGVLNYGTFNMHAGSIHNNSTVNGNGAGIYNARTLNLEGGTIQDNEISGNGYGAGIFMSGSKYSHTFIFGGEIKQNTSTKSGAGLFVNSLASCFIHGGVFEENKCTNNGGAINSRGNLYIYDGTFRNNSAGGSGGAIYQYIYESSIFGGKFEGNSAGYGGAIAFGQGAVARITGGEFVGNTATKRGGAIYLVGEKDSKAPTLLTITGGTLQTNTCENGSAFAVQYAVLEIGGTPTIDGNIKFVANATNNYAFIRFISNFSAETKFNICPASYADLKILEKILQASKDVNLEDLLENIVLDNEDFEVVIDQGHLVVKNSGAGVGGEA